MALISRQYLVCQAIQTALLADADIGSIDWTIRKLSLHRGATWSPGAYISPLTGVEVPFETQLDRVDIRALVAYIFPTEPALEDSNLITQLGTIERVEDIFRNKSGKYAPQALRDLDSAAVSPDNMSFQLATVEPGDRFVAAAWAMGFDASACVVKIQLNLPRRIVT